MIPQALRVRGRRGRFVALGTCLLVLVCAAGGCNWAALWVALTRPDEEPTTVEAEYKGPPLAGRSLAIVVFTADRVDFEYGQARRDVAERIEDRFRQEEVRKAIKDLRPDAQGALAYQKRNIHWDTMDRAQLGKALGADFVLFVTVTEFTTREPLTSGMMRGVLTGEASVYQTGLSEREGLVWRSEAVRVVYPEEASGGTPGSDDRAIVQEIINRFAQKVAWKFYKHKEPAKP